MKKVLFILKKREDYTDSNIIPSNMSTGLFNSANFVHQMLNKSSIESKLVVVIDNNDIDREVQKFKPDIVFIEALWVVPEKFEILHKLHPKVKWVIRIHSDMPFMACEGIAMKWILSYLDYKNVYLAPNSDKMLNDVFTIIHAKYKHWDYTSRIIYLPNYYPVDNFYNVNYSKRKSDTINISSFGAIRPLKNQLIQAVAAIEFAAEIQKNLRFHINGSRVEGNGLPVLHNLKALFDGDHAEVVVHEWLPHEDFLKMINEEIDIGMQMSFSETFNIVGADIISQGVPFVGCTEIPWYKWDKPYINDSLSIKKSLFSAYKWPGLNVSSNQRNLCDYVNLSRDLWLYMIENVW